MRISTRSAKSASLVPVTIVTGAGSGIGRALALQAQARGHVVYATDRDEHALADLGAQGLRTQVLDVTSAQDIAALIQRLETDRAEPTVLINNAGFGAMAPLADISPARLRSQFEVNVIAVVSLSQALIPGMAARGIGRIVNIGSVSGIVATPFAGAYCASKSAVHAISDAMRMELAPFGIEVITVQPGAIRSSFGAAASRSMIGDVPPDSLYAPVADAIEARAQAGQRGALSAEAFARRTLDAVLAARPAPVVRIGPHTLLLPLLKRYLPVRLLDRILSARFKLNRLQRAP